jgi:hypothetical protein
MQRFRSVLGDCLAAAGDRLYFRKESADHQSVDFYSINRKTYQKKNLATTRDEENLRILRKNPYDYYLLTMDTIPDNNLVMVEWQWVRRILYKPNKSVLQKIGDTISVFNVTDGSIELFDLNGKYVSSLEITNLESVEGDWTREIYVDQSSHSVYTSFIKNGLFTIYGIDLEKGDLERIARTSHAFPQKVSIHEKHLYYMYDTPGEGDNVRLFRQKI